ncbi:pyridoxamine 5'-phosphate oxidase family protein [Pseudaminobacter sp. NGMCC 1.201702]|uniref:pyridoxamine 5'-phosphate oxidase family protein n=1 Tax=Pseudaminobacter sp. NGMCC 1.201702 TaxID=3391825 RepID=UPI0039EE45E1
MVSVDFTIAAICNTFLELSICLYHLYRDPSRRWGQAAERCLRRLRMSLNQTVRTEMDRAVLCWLATVSADGTPNLSPKEIFAPYANDAVVIADIASPISVTNVQSKPKVCVSFVDVFRQRGFKLEGEAKVVDREHCPIQVGQRSRSRRVRSAPCRQPGSASPALIVASTNDPYGTLGYSRSRQTMGNWSRDGRCPRPHQAGPGKGSKTLN